MGRFLLDGGVAINKTERRASRLSEWDARMFR